MIEPFLASDKPFIEQDWQNGPRNRWAFTHISNLIPTATISRGCGQVREFPIYTPDWTEPNVSDPGITLLTLQAWLAETFTDGMVVLHNGQRVFEYCREGMNCGTQHLLMSISKSFTSLLTGILVEEGVLEVDRTAAHYVPELTGSAYGDATLQQILDMQVGVKFSEAYLDPRSEAQQLGRVAGWEPLRPGEQPGMNRMLAGLQKDGDHGEVFLYTSSTTDVLGWIIERATGAKFADLFSDRIWSRIGTQNDACVTVDAFDAPLVDGGICTSSIDLARIGQLVLDGGRVDGEQIVPEWWIQETRLNGNNDAWLRSTSFRKIRYPNGFYHNKFWVTGNEWGCFYGVGIYGQILWIDPTNDVVIAKFSSTPLPLDPDMSGLILSGMEAISESFGVTQ